MEEIQFLSPKFFEIIKSVDPPIYAGLLAGLIVFIIEVRLCVKGILFGGQDRMLEEAKKNGNIIKATMFRLHKRDINNAKGTRYIADYHYVVDGVTKKKRVITTGLKPPRELPLYYVEDPNKVFSTYDLKGNPLQLLIYVIPLAVAIAVAKALGLEV